MHNPISLDSNRTTKAPSHIDNHHYQEWLDSGVNEAITSLNVASVHDSFEVDKILNRNNKSRWQHSDNLVPCWVVSGRNPLTDEPTFLGVQVKPDKPPLDKKGKVQKYFGASNYPSTPLFLNTGVEYFWKRIIDDKTKPIILTEGAKKAGAGLSIGYATISIPGVSTCRKKGRLHPWIESFAGFGRVFYLAFDNDLMSKRQVQTSLLAMARELASTGSKAMVIVLPPGELKGMDDFIAAKGEDAFNDLVQSALTIEEWHEQVKEAWREQLEEIKSTKRSKVARYMEIIKLGWGHEVRYNQLKSQIELSSQTLDLNQIRLRIALEFDVDVPVQDAVSIVENLAKENSYHPVLDYLDGLAQKYPQPDLSLLDSLAFRYFGTDDPMHNLYMRKTLIAAVARVKEPGCKHDLATILVGAQGVGKSTFWEKLFGTDWFTDELGDANEKDELMKLHRFWGLEWSEFETVYKRKGDSSLKKFITSKIDPIRAPYARSFEDHPRQCVLVGSTNEEEILSDPTGSRRFWIIPVNKLVPIDQLEEERDEIWAAAYALYQSGEKWCLSWQESVVQQEMNKDYQNEDPWYETIQKYLCTQGEVTLAEIFHLLGIEAAKQDMGITKRITSVLRQLNWKKVRKFVNGVWVRIWEEVKTKIGFTRESESEGLDTARSPSTEETNVDISDDESMGEVSSPSPAPEEILCPRTGLPLPPAFEIKLESVLGISTAVVNFVKVRKDNRIAFTVDLTFANGKTSRKHGSTGRGKSEVIEAIEKEVDARIKDAIKHPSRRYSVYQIVGTMYEPEIVWVEGCICTEVPEHPVNSFYVFTTPSGESIRVAGENEFKLEVGT